ncbi:MAG: hypothetical protein IJV73_01570 [Clostridia bacterium]|nr:hypothetical protein [Clostridia bacterium]
MMANVIIRIGDNGQDVPAQVIETINTMMSLGVTSAQVTLTIDEVDYVITYDIIKEDKK